MNALQVRTVPCKAVGWSRLTNRSGSVTDVSCTHEALAIAQRMHHGLNGAQIVNRVKDQIELAAAGQPDCLCSMVTHHQSSVMHLGVGAARCDQLSFNAASRHRACDSAIIAHDRHGTRRAGRAAPGCCNGDKINGVPCATPLK